MYHTTGFSRDEIVELCVMVSTTELDPGINHWPPVLGLFKSVTVALTYMRRNHEAYSGGLVEVQADDG